MTRIKLALRDYVCVLLVGIGHCVAWQRWPTPPVRWERREAGHAAVVTVDLGASRRNIAMGAVLSRDRILTSYNPLRKLLKSERLMARVYVCMFQQWSRQQYACSRVRCARPVMPERTPQCAWLGPRRLHSPAHDLAVMSLVTPLQPTVVLPLNNRTLGYGRWTVIASLGLLGRQNYVQSCDEEGYDHRKFVDCDEWVPRTWGHFYCLRYNPEHTYYPIVSGAVFSSRALGDVNLVHGIGSFTMWRGPVNGNESMIFVFTDTRPYLHLIENTCTAPDAVLARKTRLG